MPHRRSTQQHDPDEQLEPAQQKAVEVWNGWLIFKRAPVTITIATLASFLTFLFTNLGFRVTGTPQEIAALNAKVQRNDSLTNVRLTRVEQTLALRADDLRELQQSVRFLSYVVCVQIRRDDPAAAPPGCDPIIRSKGDGVP